MAAAAVPVTNAVVATSSSAAPAPYGGVHHGRWHRATAAAAAAEAAGSAAAASSTSAPSHGAHSQRTGLNKSHQQPELLADDGSLESENTSVASGSETAADAGSETGMDSAVEEQPLVLATADEDTIAANVTGASTGAVAIIRISGSDALGVAAKMFRPGGKFRFNWLPESHRVHYGTVVDGDENVLDEVLLLAMLSPRSYTREDVVELHCHGGGICARRVLQAAIEAGARPARPGEFTLRAFLNGRLDLSQAEAVQELISARTARAADSALAGLRGGLGQAVSEMRSLCLDLVAELEARIDFDEDLPDADMASLKGRVEALQEQIEAALRTARQGNMLRNGLQVAIVGRPNVGKSSLLNAWSRTDRAIVTEVAGTTRDVLEAGLTVGGVPITLLDTAGIRQSRDVVEKIGVERSREAAGAADIVVMVVDASKGWTPEDGDIYRELWGDGPGTSSCRVRGVSMLVANKTDLLRQGQQPESGAAPSTSKATHLDGAPTSAATSAGAAESAASSVGTGIQRLVANAAHSAGASSRSSSNGNGIHWDGGDEETPQLSLPVLARETFQHVVHVSAHTRKGLDILDKAMLQLAGVPQLAAGGVSWAVNDRQSEALVKAHEALMRVADSVAAGLPLDFWTVDLRAALLALGEASGDEVTEEVLDSVFSRFCIGK